ncbi:MFS transporter [Campylobacter sp. FMV-PI01]|uniref:MFS transporter n=1 Tax=Campylobacter portucalensis TaxID=2608384 RepID=A0A6L5WLD1_9BACT|nr:MFS transporter [Campylobacter portucalensis]MSN96815.1 MFS transporter [Campylobacter portucalensis]
MAYINRVFFLAMISFIISFFAILFLNLKEIKIYKAPIKQLQISNFIEIKAVPISSVVFIAGFSYGSILAFLSLYTQNLNLTSGVFYYPFYSVFAIVSVWIYGKIFDDKKENFATMLSLFLFFISLIVLSKAKNNFHILISAFFLAFDWASIKSLCQTIAIKLSPKDKIGLANSTFFIFVNLGIGISLYILGMFEPIFGFRGVYQISAFALILGMIFYYKFVWKSFK